MLVCHCRRVNDRQIRRAVRSGALCVRTVATACGAGGGCGGCHSAIEAIVAEEHAAPSVEILSLSDYAAAR